MTAGKITMLVAGLLLALIGFGTTAAGGGMLWANSTQRGPDGYLESPTWSLQTDTRGITSEDLHLGAPTPEDWLWFRDFEVRIDVEAQTQNPVFVGIGPETDVQAYLQGVSHSEIARLRAVPQRAVYRTTEGTVAPDPPAEQTFWAAQTQGAGEQQLTWQPEPGTWTIVVMNADAQPGVAVQASAAAPGDFLFPLGMGLLIGGLLVLGLAAALVVASVAGTAARTPAPVAAAGSYPVTISAELDTPSRWLWLVKWLLLIPHLIVLVFLWMAFVLLTVAAGVAILFTGRYPRGIFDFNVGVVRWTWRVSYYGYSALGTDRYPPFTLAAVDYPATIDIAYPQQLSRGLVLVKSWLLAIPHLLIVALLAGGGLVWRTTDSWGPWMIGGGGGIIGLLAFVAGIMLLFTASYPGGLFDIVMGLNRWVYRVLAYVALMTDEYPPFRLDLGGSEPPAPPEPPPSAGGPSVESPELVEH